MTQSIEHLKKLLFDDEARALSEVEKRLAASEVELRAGAQERLEFGQRLDSVFARAGTEERFKAAIAGVLDKALRQAETDRHAELSEAVAPLIVRTIRTEIHNSRDELVDALYPITGRMVKAYVASAIADLASQINRSVEQNPVMLRLRSVFTGKSVAELALAQTPLQVAELFLIRRGTGELIGHWQKLDTFSAPEAAATDDHVISGVLAAINEFAHEALAAGDGTLREIDIGNERIFLRASPLYLLAARCTGMPPPGCKKLMDEAFLTVLERMKSAAGETKEIAATPAASELDGLAETISNRIGGTKRKRRFGPAKVILLSLLLLLTAWFGYHAIDHILMQRTQSSAEQVVTAMPETDGYPLSVKAGPFGRSLDVGGLLPTKETKQDLLENLKSALPNVTIVERLTPLPEAGQLISTTIDRKTIAAAIERTKDSLILANQELPQLAEVLDRSKGARVSELSALTREAVTQIENSKQTFHRNIDAQTTLAAQLSQAADTLAALTSAQPSIAQQTELATPDTLAQGARQLEQAANRLSTVTTALLQAELIRANLPKPAPPPPPPAPKLSAFERLTLWTRTNAVFFSDGLTYRSQTEAGQTLDALTSLMNETDAFLRVIGYTDTKGALSQNETLSENCATKVLEALRQRGISQDRMIAIGRQDAKMISPVVGEQSPNRRVEFEIGFASEASR